MIELEHARWKKSSWSGGQSDCVEVAHEPDEAAIRDSKNPGGAALVFTSRELQGFLATIKAGRFGA